jgi:hypothetical protein
VRKSDTEIDKEIELEKDIEIDNSNLKSSRSRLTVFLKCLQLLFRDGGENKNSTRELITNILAIYKPMDSFAITGGEQESTEKIRDYLLECLDEEILNREIILQNLNDILKTSTRKDTAIDMFKMVEEDENKNIIRALENELNNKIYIYRIKKTLNGYTYDFDKKFKSGMSPDDMLSKIIEELTILTKNIKNKDDAIVNEVDLDNIENVSKVFQVVKETNEAEGFKFKLGLRALNKITNNGYKDSEFVIWNALQHNYKSGMLASSLIGIARYNKPIMTDPSKIPLLLYVSLEDDLDILFEFLYRQMYYTDNKVKADMSNTSKEEMSKYVKDKLQETGFKVKFIRVDPSDWSYSSFFSLIEKYEKDGFELKTVILDYLSLIPTVGCIASGAVGSDLRDLYRRVRNFFAKRKCLFISAHQLSPDAQMINRENLTGEVFLNRIMGKGFFDGSKKLSQEMDLELYAYKFTQNNKDYLAIGKGKHKGSKVMKSTDKLAIIPFPENLEPIPDDINWDELDSLEFDEVKEIDKDIKGLLNIFGSSNVEAGDKVVDMYTGEVSTAA